MHVPALPHLHTADPDLAALVEGEAARRHDKLRLIASENYVSPAVLEATGSALTNKYSEGYVDVITTTTRKTLRGPRGAMVMSTAEHAVALKVAGYPMPGWRPAP